VNLKSIREQLDFLQKTIKERAIIKHPIIVKPFPPVPVTNGISGAEYLKNYKYLKNRFTYGSAPHLHGLLETNNGHSITPQAEARASLASCWLDLLAAAGLFCLR
jgi:hypothetical protein